MHTSHLLDVYNRADPLFVRGEGPWLYTETGEAWLDCVAGIATNALGHAHPVLRAALERQAAKLWHLSNMFRVEGQERLAAKLAAHTSADRCSSPTRERKRSNAHSSLRGDITTRVVIRNAR